MELKDLIFDKAPVSILTVNRPDALNALNRSVLEQIALVLREVRHDSSVRVLIVTGAGTKAFVAGADIAAMSKMSAVDGLEFSRLGHRVMQTFEDLPIPVIAAVNGFALGGGMELALACDLIVASEKARFGQPEINLGLIPGFGGTQRLPHRIGQAKARELRDFLRCKLERSLACDQHHAACRSRYRGPERGRRRPADCSPQGLVEK